MTTKRHYDDGCAAAHALDLVGERWALLVVRELLLGPQRFTDLRAGLPDISPNVLAARLRDLEAAGVLVRRALPPPAAAQVYDLTPWGRELEPVLHTLGRWGARSPARPKEAPLSAASFATALRTLFSAERAAGLDLALELQLPGAPLAARVHGGRLDLAPGPAAFPGAILAGPPAALAEVVLCGRPLADALAAGDVRLAGDPALVERFAGLFPAPDPACRAG